MKNFTLITLVALIVSSCSSPSPIIEKSSFDDMVSITGVSSKLHSSLLDPVLIVPYWYDTSPNNIYFTLILVEKITTIQELFLKADNVDLKVEPVNELNERYVNSFGTSTSHRFKMSLTDYFTLVTCKEIKYRILVNNRRLENVHNNIDDNMFKSRNYEFLDAISSFKEGTLKPEEEKEPQKMQNVK